MAALTLEEVKAYCHITDDSEDTVLEGLMTAAIDYLAGAGVPAEAKDSARYNLAVKALTLHWYDNRGNMAGGAGTQAEIPLGLGALIIQLQNYIPPAEVSNLDTETS